jgi:hypothetical protein
MSYETGKALRSFRAFHGSRGAASALKLVPDRRKGHPFPPHSDLNSLNFLLRGLF